ncbi:MAG TPA: hypothetical protein VNT26_00830, partial [Candidatus Sulfotelmatobacter sp.]|nr:hypothetical protein [Candidatus Sulfotelmatobacter sp.]
MPGPLACSNGTDALSLDFDFDAPAIAFLSSARKLEMNLTSWPLWSERGSLPPDLLWRNGGSLAPGFTIAPGMMYSTRTLELPLF